MSGRSNGTGGTYQTEFRAHLRDFCKLVTTHVYVMIYMENRLLCIIIEIMYNNHGKGVRPGSIGHRFEPRVSCSVGLFDGMFQQTSHQRPTTSLPSTPFNGMNVQGYCLQSFSTGSWNWFCAEHIVCLQVAALQKPAKVSGEGVSHQGAALHRKCL